VGLLVLQITRFIVMSNHRVLHGPASKKWPLMIAWLFSAANGSVRPPPQHAGELREMGPYSFIPITHSIVAGYWAKITTVITI
jgi:hypothetical protein